MIGSRVVLDGVWKFHHSIDGKPLEGRARRASVPGPWQAQFADLRMRAGTGLYRREFDLPKGWARGQILLKFGAVFHNTSVRLNGVPVGRHTGGFLPFAFDVTNVVRDGEINEIVVTVDSPLDDPLGSPDGPLGEMPFGKQSWYGPLSGIWQSVFLERRDPEHVTQLRVTPELASGEIVIEATLARPTTGALEAEMTVCDPAGAVVGSDVEALPAGGDRLAMKCRVPDVLAWSPDKPHLYRVSLALRREGELVDQEIRMVGFRTFEARHGQFYLNGKRFYLRGALDQDYYPDGICTPPSVEFLEDQLRKAKELGLNTFRCHIKAPDPRYYEVADRLGMLIWAELPNHGVTTRRSRARAEALLKGIVDRDGHHPSIVIWTIINENWGTDLVHNAKHRDWLKTTFNWLKRYDPGRLVVDNSPLSPSRHVQTDIADYHFYAAIPDHRKTWDSFVESLVERPQWLFETGGESATSGQEPLVCSEFGNWGLPDPHKLTQPDGKEPWWFETGHDWGDGIMYAHGAINRFHDWSLDRAFGSFDHFVEATQWQQFRALKYEIESMRRRPELAGYVITELTDCHWESNGLLDMRRNPRVFHSAFPMINADTVIVPTCSRWSYWAGEKVRVELVVAHAGSAPIASARLAVINAETRILEVPHIEPGQVALLGAIEVELPELPEPDMVRLTFELMGADGQILAMNTIDVAVHPRFKPDPSATLFSPDPEIAGRLQKLAYSVTSDMRSAGLVVAEEGDSAIAEYVRNGGALLLLPRSECGLYPFFPHWQAVRVKEREGTVWAGDWASSFSWVRRAGAFAQLPGGPLIDHTFDSVIPARVISGCNLLDFQARVHAGLVVGWVHKAAALVVERSYGEGHLVASTFQLFRDAPGSDPTASRMLDCLVRTALREAPRSLALRPAEEVLS